MSPDGGPCSQVCDARPSAQPPIDNSSALRVLLIKENRKLRCMRCMRSSEVHEVHEVHLLELKFTQLLTQTYTHIDPQGEF